MFHKGDLQSGIALAIQQSKLVACFVRDDDNPESSTWEDQWLQHDLLSQTLAAKAVVLRIQAGSQEAEFLAAFCPIVKVPTFVIIHNGQLRETLTSGIPHDEFNSRIRKALGEDVEVQPIPPASLAGASTQPNPAPTRSQPTPSPRAIAQPSQPPSNPPVSPSPTTSSPSTTAQTFRNERELSLKGKGKQRADAEPENEAPTSQSSSRSDWIQQQRQRQLEARQERDRVLAQIEADKAERRAKREEEKRQRLQRQEDRIPEPTTVAPFRPSKHSNAKSAQLQVRLLDGETIRSSFPASATLTDSVRPWIDGYLETKAPYTFKQILAPHPARTISISEEHNTLRELDLLPSATLVLQPVENYTDAYAPGPSGLLSLPYNAAAGAYGLVAGGVGAVTGTLSGAARWLRGGTYTEPEEGQGSPNGRTLGQTQEDLPRNTQAEAGASVRVRTLADQRAEDRRDNQQFYNGNSLDFQPTTDEGEGGGR